MSELWGVSIIVVNYNHAEFLPAAINSALGQEYPLCEVIVVDDCSTDNSSAVIARYGNRIRYVPRETSGVSDGGIELRLAANTSSYLYIPRLGRSPFPTCGNPRLAEDFGGDGHQRQRLALPRLGPSSH
jgi:cellulose synthase/poly-beta-1,6-N-acetylglucosamine synthase-like glycosyltransferase